MANKSMAAYGDKGSAFMHYDEEWEEWCVEFYDNEGVHQEDASYHTDDEDDARGTMYRMVGD